jgi:hypothetical protein
MTATGTTTTETRSSPPPVRPSRGVVTAAGLTAFAAVALIPSWLTTSSQTETSPIMPTWAAASPEQAAPALGQASAGWNAGSVAAPAAYVMFCQNSPVLCAPPPPWPAPPTSSSAKTIRPCVRCRNATSPNLWMVQLSCSSTPGSFLRHRRRQLKR